MSAPKPLPLWVFHAVLAVGVLFVYEPVRDFPFVVWDDKIYVTENPQVLDGLSREGAVWAFTSGEHGSYVPLAWLSHMLDVELFGLDAGAHHGVNLLLHLLSTLLLFEVLRRATGGLWPSAFAAAVFGIHPTHVESVAWVAERRDVLSGLFFVLTLAAYLGWVRARGRRPARYGLLLLCFTVGLLAKPMLVTVPLLLLLLDLWPLRRGGLGPTRLVVEKLPLLVPAAGASAVAFVTQEVAMPTLDELPVGTRVGTALIATGAYLGKTLWPVNLAAFYPLDLDVSVPRAVVSGVLLSVLSAGALLAWRSRPWLTVGWAWYLLMLAPVVGLVQIGSQSMADRYTYLPGIGLSIAAAWGVAEWTRSRPRVRQLLAGVVAAWLGVCLLLARGQVFTWRDSVALFEHSQSVTGGNVIAALNLGEAHEDAGDVERAVVQYRRALEWKPGALGANARLGALLARRGDVERAMRHLLLAVRLEPLDPEAHTELGALLLRRGAAGEAAAELERALELDPDQARAAFHLAEVRAAVGEADEAEQLFARALSARPPIEDEPLVDKHPLVLAALSRGCAAAGRPERALHWNARALVIAQLSGQAELAAQLREDAARYRASAP